MRGGPSLNFFAIFFSIIMCKCFISSINFLMRENE